MKGIDFKIFIPIAVVILTVLLIGRLVYDFQNCLFVASAIIYGILGGLAYLDLTYIKRKKTLPKQS